MRTRSIKKPIDYSLFLLSRKDYTKAEMKEKLASKGYEEREVEKALEKLENLGFLDDLRFAQRWIESRAQNRPISRKAMILELKRKGIEEGLIEEAMRKAEEEGNLPSDLDMARRLATSRMKRIGTGDRNIIMRRIYGTLARKGFSPDIITDILKEIDTGI